MFLGTTPNANWIVKKLRSVDGLSFGNDVYKVTFEEKFASKDSSLFTPFGCKYQFYLHGAVDAPEYLVHFPTLVRLAKEYGLELVAKPTFHEFYKTNVSNPQHKTLMRRMKVLNAAGTMPENNWEVAGFYLVFVFYKIGDAGRTNTRQYDYDRYFAKVPKSDIITVTD
mmetsp:Transcript_15216/g.16921  ORF Transcript_15216/g.16921 Transcript_15216/m.16921 type:complete len:168 (+) Transcript_15216:578-1081(+)